MNEQFDSALRNHIRDTFDHYDDLMADDGWKKFNKQKDKKRRGIIFWYGLPSGIAAALALLWIFNLTTLNVVKPKSETIAKNKAFKTPESTTEKPNDINNSKTAKLKQEKTKTFPKKALGISVLAKESPQVVNQIEPIANVVMTRPAMDLVNIPKSESLGAKASKINSPSTFDNIIIKESAIASTALTPNTKERFAFNNVLLENTDSYRASVNAEEKKPSNSKSSKFKFSVDANTYYSFTTAGVTDELNLGLGVLSELKLTKNLSINSGISLNRQTTRYVDNRNSFSESKSLARTAFSNQPVSVPEDAVKTNAKLVGFELPLNLKYNIAIGKLKTFVTSGVSSYSLLNQSYTNDFSVINYSFNSAPTTTIITDVDKETEGVFSNFQFARTVNFSFGIQYPVSGKNSISVEPFLQYPIAGFGSQNLEIGSGGVSFKLNFGN